MKRLILALILLFAAVPSWGAKWTVTTTTSQETRLNRHRIKMNTQTCANYGLPASCTQPQARDAMCQRTAGTPAPCAGSLDVEVFATVGDFIDGYVIRDYLYGLRREQDAEDLNAWQGWLGSASQAQKDAVCASAGLSAGCLP